MNAVAGSHRQQPAQIVDAGAEQRVRAEWLAFGGEPHGDRRSVPSRCGESTKDRLLRRFIIEMKRLRIILPRKAYDVVLRYRHRRALEAHADLQVVEPFDHAIPNSNWMALA